MMSGVLASSMRDAVHLVDDGVLNSLCTLVLQAEFHVVPEIVESELVVRFA
jgi:hypothetical protein